MKQNREYLSLSLRDILKAETVLGVHQTDLHMNPEILSIITSLAPEAAKIIRPLITKDVSEKEILLVLLANMIQHDHASAERVAVLTKLYTEQNGHVLSSIKDLMAELKDVHARLVKL